MANFCVLNCDDAKAWSPINFGHMFQTCLCDDCDCCTLCELARDKELPADIMSFDAVVITGSRHNCRDSDSLSWFEPLCNFIQRAAEVGSPRIYGGCFGCQVVAHALGGEVGYNPGNVFLLKAEDVLLEACFQHHLPGEESPQSLKLIVSHGDCVLRLPPHSE
ncbi:hypothetical protein B484DRAFT_426414, partial [Ochromonadaceae sp. CCMP2298]